MLFTYWTGSELAEPSSFAAWRERFPGFFMFKDEDVIPLLESELYRDIFRKIRIPACKSDIARVVLLRHYGGLYLDAHTGPANGDRLAETLEFLARFDLTLFSQGWVPEFQFGNGWLVARRYAPILDVVLTKAFENIIEHKKIEDKTSEYVPYNILQLTGSAVFLNCIFDPTPRGWEIKSELKEKVGFIVMPAVDSQGFLIASHNDYRKPGSHWSERQQKERLFL